MKKNSGRFARQIIFCLLFCSLMFQTTNFSNLSSSSSSFPSSSATSLWWDQHYQYRIPLLITNPNSEPIPVGYVSKVTLNSANLVLTGKMMPTGQDLRIVWFDEQNSQWVELDRINNTAFNTNSTEICFSIQQEIDSSDSNYFLYYGYIGAPAALIDPSNIFTYFNDFNVADGSLTEWSTNSGIWEVRDHKYCELDSTSTARALNDEVNIKNLELEVQINCSGTNIGAGVVLRYQNDKKNYIAGIGIAGYQVALVDSTSSTSYDMVANNGESESLLVSNIWYTFKVAVYETNFKLYLDGILELEVSDSTQNKVGEFGLEALTADFVSFDNLKVRPLLEYEPEMITQNEEEYQFALTEVTDPLEMGEYLEVSIEFDNTDNIEQVLIEYENSNHSMEKKEKKFTNKGWKPKTLGSMDYSVHIQYTDLTWKSLKQSLHVRDTIKPQMINTLNASTKILPGQAVIIDIDINETGSGINSVVFNLNTMNYTMYTIDEDTWRCDRWSPADQGTYSYKLYLIDNAGNINVLQNSINVEIAAKPTTTDDTNPDKSDTTPNDPEPDGLPSYIIIIGVMSLVMGAVVIISRPMHRAEKSRQTKISLKSTLSHLHKIAELEVVPNSYQKNTPKSKIASLNSESIKKNMKKLTLKDQIPANLHETLHCAENASTEGAFLEAAGRYSAIATELDSKGLKDLSLLFKNKAEEIQTLIQEREQLEQELQVSQIPEKKIEIGKLILAIIEISEKLNDEETVKEYQSMLEEISQPE